MKYLLITLLLVACGKMPNVSITVPDNSAPTTNTDPSTAKAKPNTDIIAATPTPSPTTTPIVVTAYSLTKTLVTVSGGPNNGMTLQGIGMCAVVSGDTYCWDDGLKVLPGNVTGYTYWGLNQAFLICPNVAGGCADDLMTAPTLITANVTSKLHQNFGFSSYRSSSEVVTNGVPTDYNCTEDVTAKIDCGTFIIDTAQTPL